MEVIETQRGGQKLCYQGYTYTKQNLFGTKVRKILWQCSQRHAFDCKGCITTSNMIDSVFSSGEHSHDPDYSQIEAMKLKVELKKLALVKKGKKPREIVAEVLASQSPETQAAIGDVAKFEKLLRRTRLQKAVVVESPATSVGVDEWLKQEDISISGDFMDVEPTESDTSLNLPIYSSNDKGNSKRDYPNDVCEDAALNRLLQKGWSQPSHASVKSTSFCVTGMDHTNRVTEISVKSSTSIDAAVTLSQNTCTRQPLRNMALEQTTANPNKHLNNLFAYSIPVLKPTEKYECTKQLCKSLALLASQVRDEIFRQRFAMLQKLHDEWMSYDNDYAADESRVLANNAMTLVDRCEPEKIEGVTESAIKKSLPVSKLTVNVDMPCHEKSDLQNITKLSLPTKSEPVNVNDEENDDEHEDLGSDNDITENDIDTGATGTDVAASQRTVGTVNSETLTMGSKIKHVYKLRKNNKPVTYTDTGEESYACHLCNASFKREHGLKWHMRKHKIFSCKQCNKRFAGEHGLRIHERAHDTTLNPDGTRRRFQCPLCDRTLSEKRGLENHIRAHRGERPYSCEICGRTFGVPNTLRQHMRLHTNDRRHTCDVCGKAFFQHSSLQRHIISHTNIKPWNCELCAKEFTDQSALIRHRHKIHTGVYVKSFRSPREPKPVIKSFICPVCGKTMRSRRSLEDHVNIHTNNRPYKCSECPKAFHDSSSLHKHKYRHSGILNYVCTVCGAAFPFGTSLRSHMRTHNDVRPFQCTRCPMAYNNKHGLIVHERIHSGERPFRCHDCGKTFRDPSILARHRPTHTGYRPHVCTSCGKGFKDARALMFHTRIHTGYRPHLCTLCPMKFKMTNTLKKHMRCMHTCPICKERMPSEVLKEHKAAHGCEIIGNTIVAVEKDKDLSPVQVAGFAVDKSYDKCVVSTTCLRLVADTSVVPTNCL